MCIAVCPEKAIKVPWHGATNEELQKKIVDYAGAVLKLMKNKIIFINILENITKDCDCFDTVQKPIIDDLGILAGEDAVAIDKASSDLVKRFDSIQADYAAEKGLGKKEYELVGLDD